MCWGFLLILLQKINTKTLSLSTHGYVGGDINLAKGFKMSWFGNIITQLMDYLFFCYHI